MRKLVFTPELRYIVDVRTVVLADVQLVCYRLGW